LREYYIGCEYCEEETEILTYAEEAEPGFCPHCGTEVNAELIDELDE
jgi:hypothetical protein